MSTQAYTLGNGEERHANHPETFLIPTRAARESMVAKDKVRLMFNFEGFTERMDVRITEKSSTGEYTGIILSSPWVIPIEKGAQLKFGPEHVIDIFIYENEQRRLIDRRHEHEQFCVETD